jgi:hypothetical protein
MTKIVSSRRNTVLSTKAYLGSCCGASAVNKPAHNTRFNNAGKGIRVFAGKYSEEFDNGKTYLSHVETSAGPLTITVQYDR